MGLVAGLSTARIAEDIHDQCGPIAGTSRIRAYRLALGVSLADLVARRHVDGDDLQARGSVGGLAQPPDRRNNACTRANTSSKWKGLAT